MRLYRKGTFCLLDLPVRVPGQRVQEEKKLDQDRLKILLEQEIKVNMGNFYFYGGQVLENQDNNNNDTQHGMTKKKKAMIVICHYNTTHRLPPTTPRTCQK